METCISQLSLQWQKTWDNQLNWTGFILASGFNLTPLGRTAPGLWGGKQHGGKWGIKWSCLSQAAGKQRQRGGYWVFIPSMKAHSQTSFQWATPPLAVTPPYQFGTPGWHPSLQYTGLCGMLKFPHEGKRCQSLLFLFGVAPTTPHQYLYSEKHPKKTRDDLINQLLTEEPWFPLKGITHFPIFLTSWKHPHPTPHQGTFTFFFNLQNWGVVTWHGRRMKKISCGSVWWS